MLPSRIFSLSLLYCRIKTAYQSRDFWLCRLIILVKRNCKNCRSKFRSLILGQWSEKRNRNILYILATAYRSLESEPDSERDTPRAGEKERWADYFLCSWITRAFKRGRVSTRIGRHLVEAIVNRMYLLRMVVATGYFPLQLLSSRLSLLRFVHTTQQSTISCNNRGCSNYDSTLLSSCDSKSFDRCSNPVSCTIRSTRLFCRVSTSTVEIAAKLSRVLSSQFRVLVYRSAGYLLRAKEFVNRHGSFPTEAFAYVEPDDVIFWNRWVKFDREFVALALYTEPRTRNNASEWETRCVRFQEMVEITLWQHLRQKAWQLLRQCGRQTRIGCFLPVSILI